ncbi:patatin-like phospholipase family protein [Rhizobium ruizarguesonis]|uniref:patatin-like phospholipase family protein n=1 Tax=Rhizobium ruizarguesonis TaxID=2081791 RepID=UPI00163A1D80|nr:patatin-like phospholipase family protein [Rhizobium ruizarguesonis]MBC2807016.1 patatin-like phospholipase family protein [Rhizobium ruizarguesonis]
MSSTALSILAGLAAAGLLLLVVVKQRWVVRRLPLLFLCAIVILLCLVQPAQLTDTFVAMSDQKQYAGLAVGFFILALMPFVICLVRLDDARLSIFDTIVCLLPAVTLAGLGALSAPYSAYLSVPAILVGWAAARWSPLSSPRVVSRKNTVLATLGFLYGVISLVLAFSPVWLPTTLGPIVIFSLGLLLPTLIIAAIMQYPKSALCFLLVWLAVAAFNKQFATIPVGKTQPGRTAKEALEIWLATRLDAADRYEEANRPLPLIIMSAEGGGIYAAAHSFLGYRALTHYCPQLKTQVFATIGVSGGALGFVMERALNHPQADTQCRDDLAPKDIPDAITADLLSPVLANLLLRQPIAWLMPFWNTLPDGGSTLAETLSLALGSTSDTLSNMPEDAALLFVTTDARSGSRVIFSPIRFEVSGELKTFSLAESSPGEAIGETIINAAVASARFPFLTQSAVFNDGKARHVLVDGGYADNTGALTASNLISAIRKIRIVSLKRGDCSTLSVVFTESFLSDADWKNCKLPLFLAHVAFAADPTLDTKPHADPTFVDPLLALLSARVSEARRALNRLQEGQRNPALDITSHVDNGFYEHRIAHSELALPLGWRLSPSRAIALLNDIAPIDLCEVETKDGARWGAAEQSLSVTPEQAKTAFPQRERKVRQEAIRRRTGCSMRVLMRLFDFKGRVSINGFN